MAIYFVAMQPSSMSSPCLADADPASFAWIL